MKFIRELIEESNTRLKFHPVTPKKYDVNMIEEILTNRLKVRQLGVISLEKT